MADGGFVVYEEGGEYQYQDGITNFVVLTCMVAATGGLIFGYDVGLTGGVTSMEQFLKQFFPSVYQKENDEAGIQNQYCKFESQQITLFTSSIYISALISSLFASTVTRASGRKRSMLFGGLVFLTGSILNGVAVNISMLIIGRLWLGVGVGFALQSVPIYLSEMAPAKIRGALNICFQMAVTNGILVANLVNYGTAQISGGRGWRVSLGLAAVPAIMMTVGSFFLPETPNSILERGNSEEAKQMLQKIRGSYDVDKEFQQLVEACEAAKTVQHPWKNILSPRYRPQLIICILVPLFQQLTGINAIMFYAPVLFKALGFGGEASLMSSVITGMVNVLATFVSIFTVDKFGRRILFLEGGIQMIICQIGAAIMIGAALGADGKGLMSESEADFLLILICLYVAAFAWSWGPLGWLVPSEICPLEIRSAGQAINVSVNMFFTFSIAQVFLPMLCRLKFGIFLFLAGFIVIMTVFVYFFLPETKNVPIEEMNRVWKAHWFWGKYIPDDSGPVLTVIFMEDHQWSCKEKDKIFIS